MRIFTLIAAAMALLATPAFADPVCDQSKININDIYTGKDPVNGLPADAPRMKGEKPYKDDMAAFYIDAFREISDLHQLCPAAEWPAYTQLATIKAQLAAAAKAEPARYCSPAPEGGFSAVSFIQQRFKDEEIQAFAHRIKETGNSYDPFRQDDWDAQTHFGEATYLKSAAEALTGACSPNDQAKLAFAAADTAIKIARENLNFIACWTARKQLDGDIKSFDTLAQTNDVKKLEAAYKALDKATAPVRNACKASQEGLRETNYIIASKKIRILIIEPTCREAAQAMSNVRTQQLNTITAPDQHPAALTAFKASAKAAKKACKNDGAIDTWANFVDWISTRNLTRIRWQAAE